MALAAHEPAPGKSDPRGFEWFALRDELRGDPAEVFRLGNRSVRRFRTAPDGAGVIVEDDSDSLLEWRPAAGTLHRLAVRGNIHAVANDGTLVVGLGDGWGTLPPGQTNVTRLSGSRVLLDATPDGAVGLLVDSAATNFVLTLRRRSDGAALRTIAVPKLGAYLGAATLSPGAMQVALEFEREAGLERFRRLELWDLNRGGLRWRLNPTNRIRLARFSPDDRHLAVSFGGATVWLLDAQTGRLEHALTAHTDRVNDFAFAPAGNLLATAGADQTVSLWSVAGGTRLRTWRGHTAAVNTVAWLAGGTRIVSADNDGEVRIWSPDTPFPVPGSHRCAGRHLW